MFLRQESSLLSTPPADTLKCQPQIFQCFMTPGAPCQKNIPVVGWHDTSLALAFVCQSRVVSILESGWQSSTHAYQVLSVLCANISNQVFSYYWELAITSPVLTIFKAWCSGALTTNPLSFLVIKGIVKQVLKQENGEGDKTNFVLQNRQTFPNN